MNLSPIALFVYDRLAHTKKTIEALRENYLARESELFVFSDAPKNQESEGRVKLVREYLSGVDGFRKVSVYEHKENLGPSRSIVEGITEIINRYGKIIVLEDDLLLSRYFLKYMNDALVFYEKEEKVISVCGHTYPVCIENQETFFLRIADCWGWATWKRGWDLFEPDANKLLKGLKAKKLLKRLDLNGAHGYSKMLRKQAANTISSWAIRWYSSALLNEKLSLYPYKSLVQNIGFDDSGTNCRGTAAYFADIFQGEVVVSKIPLEEDQRAIKKIMIFFRLSLFNKIGCIIRKILTRGFVNYV